MRMVRLSVNQIELGVKHGVEGNPAIKECEELLSKMTFGCHMHLGL